MYLGTLGMSQPNAGFTTAPSRIGMPSDCSIREAGSIAEAIRDLLSSARSADLDCADVDTVDITFVQLVASARNSFAARGLSLKVENPSAAVLLAFARASVSLA
uniref:STAS domain-containing protein n=1 Tax=Bosea sp. NBC_00436 TaxID=2969620 RepID=A0A9E7ZVR6_9HYPH